MTREEALRNMNLSSSASREEIEKAYRRLVLRYPPEFHPERFRQIDESYRLLTSLAFLLQELLASSEKDCEPDRELFRFSPTLPDTILPEALREIKRRCLIDLLWGMDGGS